MCADRGVDRGNLHRNVSNRSVCCRGHSATAIMLKKMDNCTHGNVSCPVRYSAQCRIFVCAYRPRDVARSVRFVCDPAFVDIFSYPFLLNVFGVVDDLSIRVGMFCVLPSMTGSVCPWLYLDSILAHNHGEG